MATKGERGLFTSATNTYTYFILKNILLVYWPDALKMFLNKEFIYLFNFIETALDVLDEDLHWH